MTSYCFFSDSLLKVRICRPLHWNQHLLRQTCLLCQMGLVSSFWHICLRATYAQTYAKLCVSDLNFKGNRGQRNKQDPRSSFLPSAEERCETCVGHRAEGPKDARGLGAEGLEDSRSRLPRGNIRKGRGRRYLYLYLSLSLYIYIYI